MKPPRPYLSCSIIELEKTFRKDSAKADVLANLIVELAHRRMPRARKLEKKVLKVLSNKKSAPLLNEPSPSPERLLTVAEHREVAAHLRAKEADWSEEERRVALDYAKLHEFLADFIERRSRGPAIADGTQLHAST